MRGRLIRFCLWALGKLGYVAPPCGCDVCTHRGMVCYAPPDAALFAAAQPLVARVEPLPQSGEWKRHQVYAALLKQFPATPKRVIARAIEDALCGLA